MGALVVQGIGLWAPGFENAEAWRQGEPDPSVSRPAAALVPARQRRRLSGLSRAMITAFGEAITDANVNAENNAADLPTVFGSAYGESATLMKLLDQRHSEDGALSPLSFAASVHNTASGALSIATGATGFTTSIAAGDETLAMCLLEAMTLLDDGHCRVAVVVGDCAPPAELVPADELFDTLAVALLLSGDGGDAQLGHLRGLRLAPPTLATAPPSLRFNPCAGALPLLDALQQRRAGPVDLQVMPARAAGRSWTVDMHFGDVSGAADRRS